MTTKFLQALAKLKPTSASQVRAVREAAKTSPRGAAAFKADVYRRKRVKLTLNVPSIRISEH